MLDKRTNECPERSSLEVTDIVVIIVGDDGGDDVVEGRGASGRRKGEFRGEGIADSFQRDLFHHFASPPMEILARVDK